VPVYANGRAHHTLPHQQLIVEHRGLETSALGRADLGSEVRIGPACIQWVGADD
jgi:hypothetical protein